LHEAASRSQVATSQPAADPSRLARRNTSINQPIIPAKLRRKGRRRTTTTTHYGLRKSLEAQTLPPSSCTSWSYCSRHSFCRSKKTSLSNFQEERSKQALAVCTSFMHRAAVVSCCFQACLFCFAKNAVIKEEEHITYTYIAWLVEHARTHHRLRKTNPPNERRLQQHIPQRACVGDCYCSTCNGFWFASVRRY